MKTRLNELAAIKEENEDESNRSEAQILRQQQERRNGEVSEESKEVIPSEELEQIDQAVTESLKEAKRPAFNSSSVCTIDHRPEYLAKKQTLY